MSLSTIGCQAILGIGDTSLSMNVDAGALPDGPDLPVDAPGPIDAPGSDGPVRGVVTSVSTSPIRVVRDGSATVTITITRSAPTADITVSFSQLPGGVNADTGMISSSMNQTKIQLTAAAGATLGPATIMLTATQGSTQSVTAMIALMVADPPGTPDATFNGGGTLKSSCQTSCGRETIVAVATASDGSIVIAGRASTEAPLLGRVTVNGVLDGNFGTAGFADTSSLTAESLTAVALQPTGRILAGGTPVGAVVGAVHGFTSAGVLDQSFGATAGGNVGGGTATLTKELYGLGVQSTGAIVVVTSSGPSEICRFDRDGRGLDPAFQGGACLIYTEDLAALAIAGDDSIEAAGTASETGDEVAIHLTADGIGVGGFGTAGVVPGTSAWSPIFVADDGGGEILLAGYDTGFYQLTRLAANGSVDGGFAGGASVGMFPGMNTTTVIGVVVQNDGKVILAGYGTGTDGAVTNVLLRYLASGDGDPDFGDGGVILEPTPADVQLNAIALEPDGRIILVGELGSTGYFVERIWD